MQRWRAATRPCVEAPTSTAALRVPSSPGALRGACAPHLRPSPLQFADPFVSFRGLQRSRTISTTSARSSPTLSAACSTSMPTASTGSSPARWSSSSSACRGDRCLLGFGVSRTTSTPPQEGEREATYYSLLTAYYLLLAHSLLATHGLLLTSDELHRPGMPSLGELGGECCRGGAPAIPSGPSQLEGQVTCESVHHA